MTKQEILDELYRSKKVEQLMAKIPDGFREDLKQEVFMLMLVKPEVEILDLHKRGKTYSLLAKMIYNQLFWDRSQFHILYNTYQFKEVKGLPSDKVQHDDFGSYKFCSDENDIPASEPDFNINEEIEDAMEKLSPYHQKLMRLYAEMGTYRAVGAYTNIAWKSVYNAVTNARKELKLTIEL